MKLIFSKKGKLQVERQKSLFTKEFAIGLVLACFIHIGALSLFQIDLSEFLKPIQPLMPTVVTSDLAKTEVELSEEKQELPIPDYLQFEKSRVINLDIAIQLPAIQEPPLDFSGIDLEYNKKGPFKSSFRFSRGPIPKESNVSLISEFPCKATLTYKVLATGVVFFIDWIQRTGNKKLDQEIESTLKKMTIQTPSSLFATEGVLDVEFSS